MGVYRVTTRDGLDSLVEAASVGEAISTARRKYGWDVVDAREVETDSRGIPNAEVIAIPTHQQLFRIRGHDGLELVVGAQTMGQAVHFLQHHRKWNVVEAQPINDPHIKPGLQLRRPRGPYPKYRHLSPVQKSLYQLGLLFIIFFGIGLFFTLYGLVKQAIQSLWT